MFTSELKSIAGEKKQKTPLIFFSGVFKLWNFVLAPYGQWTHQILHDRMIPPDACRVKLWVTLPSP